MNRKGIKYLSDHKSGYSKKDETRSQYYKDTRKTE